MLKILNTPILKHFVQLNLPVPSHFNQSMMLNASRRLNVYALKCSLTILVKYHDMLRAVWDGKQLSVRDANATNTFYLEEHDLKKCLDVAADMLPLCESLQSSIDIANGPMMRVAVFHLPDRDVLLVVIHHLVVDGVSWRILTEDLNRIYSTLIQGKLTVNLPKRKCSFANYALAINDYAKSVELLREEPYWQEVVNRINNSVLPSSNRTHEFATASFKLDAGHTYKLLTEGPQKYRADINSLLLTALSRAWKEVMGINVLSISQEGHGREQFGAQPLALERLVGWFTTIFPVALTYEETDFKEHVSATHAMLQGIPNKGMGYGVLMHIVGKEGLYCDPLLTFNYLGSFDESSTSSIMTFDHTLPEGNAVSPENEADTALSINCAVVDGILAGALTYDQGLIDNIKAETLCNAFISQLTLL